MDEFDEDTLDALRDGKPTALTNYGIKSTSPTTRARACSVEGLNKHYEAITDAVDIHIVPYAHADDPIPFDVLKKLVDEDRVSYMKRILINLVSGCQCI